MQSCRRAVLQNLPLKMRECKKCLLLEAGKDKSYSQIGDLLSLADSAEKVDKSEYIRRLSLCRGCDFLMEGMCVKCGCYVEYRAAFINKNCADYENKKW